MIIEIVYLKTKHTKLFLMYLIEHKKNYSSEYFLFYVRNIIIMINIHILSQSYFYAKYIYLLYIFPNQE